MRYFLLPLKFLICPIILVLLGTTALIQYFYFRDGKWEYWREFNCDLIDLLPWN